MSMADEVKQSARRAAGRKSQMLDEIANAQWNQYAQPAWNSEGELTAALRALAFATPETGEAAYSRMLYALGNNHAGTYFPIALAVVPFFGVILRDSESTARRWTLEVLTDLVVSFEPEPGFELVTTPTERGSLRELLSQKVVSLKEAI